MGRFIDVPVTQAGEAVLDCRSLMTRQCAVQVTRRSRQDG